MREYSIKKGIIISLLITAITAILTVSLIWVFYEIKESKQERKDLRKESLELQKNRLRNRVNQIIHYIQYQDKHNKHTLVEKQEQILDFIASIRFGSGGYVFINTLDGQALVFDGKKQTEYLNNLQMTDIHGKNLFTPQIKAFHNGEEGGFMQYFFKRIGGTEEEPKLSYMKGFHKWNWIIGAGEYLNDIDKELSELEEGLKKNLKTRIFYIAILLIILSTVLTIFSIAVSNYIKKQFKVFNDYFLFSETGDIIDIKKLSIKDLKKIAIHANEMINKIDNTTKLLIESEEKFRTSIDNSADAIFITDVKGNYLYVNIQACNLLGYTYQELTQMNILDLSPKKDKELHIESFKNLNKDGRMFIEVELKRKDGNIIPVDLNAIALPNGTFIGSCRDISKRKQAESELKEHQENLENLVQNRTKELEEKNIELERFNKLFVGREFRIKELKEKLSKYEKEDEE